MARPKTPFEKSPQSAIFAALCSSAPADGAIPGPSDCWRTYRAKTTHQIPLSTFYYHWCRLIESTRIGIEPNGVYRLAKPIVPTVPIPARPTPRRSRPASDLQLSLGF